MPCNECHRLKQSIFAIVASLASKDQALAIKLARTAMHGGSVNSSLDITEVNRRYLEERRFSRRAVNPVTGGLRF